MIMANWRAIFLAGSVLSASLCAYLARNCATGPPIHQRLFCAVVEGFVWLSAVLSTAICLDICLLHPARTHSLKSLVKQYLLLRLLPLLLAHFLHSRFQRITRNVQRTQHGVFLRILQKASDSEYGQSYGFKSIKTVEQFKKVHPLTSYDHYKVYIDRVERGEENVLTNDATIYFGMTSGTTGTHKLIPVTNMYRQSLLESAMHGVSAHRRHFAHLRRSLRLSMPSSPRQTQCGIPVGPVSNIGGEAMSSGITPLSCFTQVYHEPTVLYIHALFGLAEEDMGHIEGLSAQLVCSFFSLLENRWQDLCDDIETGTLNKTCNVRDDVRRMIESFLIPKAPRAAKLRCEFRKGFHGIAKRIWPNITYSVYISTGSFGHYTKKLANFSMQGVPHWSPVYICTEGILGVCMTEDGNEDVYTLLPNSLLYEFIPLAHTAKDDPDTLLMHQLRKDECYELVLTNGCGLYRYRLGDVVKVTGFTNECPVVEYLYRLGNALNLAQEFTTETLIYSAIEQTESELSDTTVTDYTATESIVLDQHEVRGRHTQELSYVLFIEIHRHEGCLRLTEEEKFMFERNLCAAHHSYEYGRKSGKFGAMKIIQVREGTFQHLKTAMTARASNPQFKMPRVLRQKDFLQLLVDNEL